MKKIDSMTFRGSKRFCFVFRTFPKKFIPAGPPESHVPGPAIPAGPPGSPVPGPAIPAGPSGSSVPGPRDDYSDGCPGSVDYVMPKGVEYKIIGPKAHLNSPPQELE